MPLGDGVAQSSSSGAAPDKTARSVERSYWSTIGCLASATAIGGAMKAKVHLWSWMLPRNSREVELRHRDQPRARRAARG